MMKKNEHPFAPSLIIRPVEQFDGQPHRRERSFYQRRQSPNALCQPAVAPCGSNCFRIPCYSPVEYKSRKFAAIRQVRALRFSSAERVRDPIRLVAVIAKLRQRKGVRGRFPGPQSPIVSGLTVTMDRWRERATVADLINRGKTTDLIAEKKTLSRKRLRWEVEPIEDDGSAKTDRFLRRDYAAALRPALNEPSSLIAESSRYRNPWGGSKSHHNDLSVESPIGRQNRSTSPMKIPTPSVSPSK